MFDAIFSLFISVCEFLIYEKYLKDFLGRQKFSKQVKIIFFVICVMLWSITSPQMNPLINLTISISVFIIFSLQFSSSIITRLIVVSLYVGIVFLTEPITLLVLKAVEFGSEEYFICIISELVRVIVVMLVSQMKLRNIVTLPKRISRILIAIPLIGVINYCIVIEIAQKVSSIHITLLCVTIILMIVATNYLLFFVFNKFNDILYQKHEDELYIQEMKYKEAYYAEVKECNEYVQDIKHDLKNRIGALYDSIDSSDEFAAGKVKELLSELEAVDNRIVTDNAALNSILRIKLTLAKDKDIRTEIKVQVPMNMNIDCGDLGILFGNLLDNAIEASEKVRVEDRYIRLECKYIEGSLILIIKNSKTPEQNQFLKTSKADKRSHGRGINSVRRVVDKYNGTIQFKNGKEEFEVNVILYGIK